MTNHIIAHQFDFWKYIGTQGNFFTETHGYCYNAQNNWSWPSKIFGIDPHKLDIAQLHIKITSGLLPNAVAIAKDPITEKFLLTHHFKETSDVKGMSLDLSIYHKPTTNAPSIQEVDTTQKAVKFAEIASKSFGYQIHPKTITALGNTDSRIRLYLGSYQGSFASCGIIYLDSHNISGIHMIGTVPKYRGLGLGKIMTAKLIDEAFRNQSKTVVLVASKLGEKIYSKMGFIPSESLKSYALTQPKP